ncbi:MAG: alpha/beta hydrolase [Caldilineaceae bacterium]|nr:alpha/beta hydrolase [Caldilineaceae bacterium]
MAHLHDPKNPIPPLSVLKRRRPFWMRLLTMFAALLLVFAAVVVFWALNAAPPMEAALASLQSTDTVAVTSEPWLTFQPHGQSVQQGFIFYPGGRVDARAYAPLAHALAEAGIMVVIPSMPLNLAILAPNSAQEIMDVHSEIQTWTIGGHSLGGTASAAFVASHPNQVQQLILLASYPSESLAARGDLRVLSIYGTADGLIPPAEMEAKRPLLPPNTVYVRIEGGDHAQFGWYGEQSGDNPATIDRASQQAQTVRAIEEFLGVD